MILDWQHFQTHNQSNTRAFEAFCNQLFERYCKREYNQDIQEFVIVNGSGGDGGVESYARLKDNSFIGLQAKWFIETLTDKQIKQIKSSIRTALNLRQNIKKYIVCVPRDFNNLKNGRGNKPIETYEYRNWTNFVNELKDEYPNLEIILWGDNEILNQLQNEECYHLNRYWFEISNFDYNLLTDCFNQEKGSWLKYKYFPDLHISGQISKKLEEYIGINKSKLLSVLNDINNNYHDILNTFREIKQWCKTSDELNNLINDICITITNNITTVEDNKNLITKEKNINTNSNIQQINFKNILEIFEKLNGCSNSYHRKLEKIINNYQYISFDYIQKNKQLLMDQHVLWIIGSPGTGKTHGVASFIDNCLTEKYNIPIFITAKNVSINDSWKDIFIKALKLADNWSEQEILSALESLCILNEINNVHTQTTNDTSYKSKIIICIDGLDEVQPYNLWIHKINLANEIGKIWTRIKFVFTSRHNVLSQINYDDDLRNTIFYINEDGDTPTYKLFDSYISAYNIKIENPDLIKWVLHTPLTLKLFCDLFKNKKVNGIENKTNTLTSLIRKKLDNIEKDFCNQYSKFSKSNNVIYNILVLLSDFFIQNAIIYEKEIVKIILNNDNLCLIDKSDIKVILDFLENNGFLQSYIEHSEKILSPKTVYYMKGIQPFFDYILAVRLIDRYENPLDTEFSQSQMNAEDSLPIYSALLLEKKNTLISDIPYFRNKIDCEELVRLDFFAIVNNSIAVSKEYKERILKFMGQNATSLIMTLNELILHVARVPNHPLGAILLHNFLSNFENAMQRDIIWSVQKWLRDSIDEKWYCQLQIELDQQIYELTINDKFDGLPLIYAWSLTNIDNIKREQYRKELMKWAISCPDEFIKLLDLTYVATNDPQMKEELLALAMGLAYSKSANIEIMMYLRDFIFKNIFTSSKIVKTNNIAIRQYARCIAETLFINNIITKKEVDLCRPPFINHKPLILYLNAALNGSRMFGFGQISYDLSRYVLCDAISRLFFERGYNSNIENPIELYGYFNKQEIATIIKNFPNLNNSDKKKLNNLKKYLVKQEQAYKDFQKKLNINLSEQEQNEIDSYLNNCIDEDIQNTDPYKNYNNVATKLLKHYSKSYNLDTLSDEQFIIGTAYAYLIQYGWNKDTENLDIRIKSHYSPSTHGSKSKIMTLCEKYIWCFKHDIYGYLSDNIIPQNDYEIEKIDDYSLLVSDLINPAQELYNTNIEENMLYQDWYVPEKLSPIMPNIKPSKQGIKQWINNAPLPTFKKWIEIKDYKPLLKYNKQWLCLYSFNLTREPNLKTETCLFLNSLIILQQSFPLFLKDIKNNKKSLLNILLNNNDIYSQTITDCYITPKEICQMTWKKSCYDEILFKTIDKDKIVDYKLTKCIERCTANYADGNDVYYELPSRYLRNILGISDGDGSIYVDKNSEVIATYYTVGKPWIEQQNFLCIDKNMLLEKLDYRNEMIVWIVKIMREPNHICHEKYKDLHIYKDSVWLVWFDKNQNKWNQLCFNEKNM